MIEVLITYGPYHILSQQSLHLVLMILTVSCDNKIQLRYLCLPRCNSEVCHIHSQIIPGGGFTNKDLKEVWKLLYCSTCISCWGSIYRPVIVLISSWWPCFDDQLLRRVDDNDFRGDPLQGIGTCEIHKQIQFCVCTATLVRTRISYMASPYTLKELSASWGTGRIISVIFGINGLRIELSHLVGLLFPTFKARFSATPGWHLPRGLIESCEVVGGCGYSHITAQPGWNDIWEQFQAQQ